MSGRVQLLRFPTAVERDSAIDAWFESRASELGAIARPWYERMRECGNDVRELLHDGHPTACVGDAAFGYVNAFTAHVNVGFFLGAHLADPAGLLEGTGKSMRHVKLRPGAEIDRAALAALIQDAYSRVRSQMAKQQSVSVATLKAIAAAFNAHDLDAIMEFFAEDCSLDMPRGPDPWGKRFTGKAAVREGLATRLKGLPDVHYSDDRHWMSGNMGVSEWLLTGTTPDGVRIQVRGCDHWEFREGKVIRKDSYWKIVDKPL